MRYINVICALLLTAATYAQTVRLEVAGNLVELEAQQTQSELKPGWKIADVKLKDKVVRYLWGAHATQLTDDRTPTFVITPAAGQVLCDFAMMRLKSRRNHRRMAKPELKDNEYSRVEPATFEMKSDGKQGFVCKPRNPLDKGEYILVYLNQTPIGELRDLKVYSIQVP